MLPHEDESAMCLAMSSLLTTMESMNIILAVDGRRLSKVNSSTVGSASTICTFFTCFLLLCAVAGDRQARDSVAAAIAMIVLLFIVLCFFLDCQPTIWITSHWLHPVISYEMKCNDPVIPLFFQVFLQVFHHLVSEIFMSFDAWMTLLLVDIFQFYEGKTIMTAYYSHGFCVLWF